jgi:antirestriction protein ArdC
VKRASDEKDHHVYRILMNRNHASAVRFATLAHELAHLFLGHLGADKKLGVPLRPFGNLRQRELEAESVAFIVCARNGVASRSETYLASYVDQNTTIADLDIYQVMRAAGQIETLLGLGARTKF